MSVSAKDILGMIIGVSERLDAAEARIKAHGDLLDAWPPALQAIIDRFEALETPEPFEPTGDPKIDTVVDQFNAWIAASKEENAALRELVSKLQDDLGELLAERRAQDHRLGRSIDVRSLQGIAEQAEKDALQGFRL